MVDKSKLPRPKAAPTRSDPADLKAELTGLLEVRCHGEAEYAARVAEDIWPHVERWLTAPLPPSGHTVSYLANLKAGNVTK